MRLLSLLLATSLIAVAGCAKPSRPHTNYTHIGPDSPPAASYERPPEAAFARSDFAIGVRQMSSYYDVPGEAGYFMDGADYGFDSLSFIMTETQPHGGPPLHTHDTEEAHVIYSGRIEYLIGDRRFTVDGPCIVRIPAGVPHAFVNVGDTPLNVTGVFPSKRISYTQKGPNPLIHTKER